MQKMHWELKQLRKEKKDVCVNILQQSWSKTRYKAKVKFIILFSQLIMILMFWIIGLILRIMTCHQQRVKKITFQLHLLEDLHEKGEISPGTTTSSCVTPIIVTIVTTKGTNRTTAVLRHKISSMFIIKTLSCLPNTNSKFTRAWCVNKTKS